MSIDKQLTQKTHRTSSMKRTPRTMWRKKGRDKQYWILEVYENENKQELLKKEIFDTSQQIADANPHIFKNRNMVLNFRKRHSDDCKKKMRITKGSPEIYKRIKLYRKVYINRITITASTFLKKEKENKN